MLPPLPLAQRLNPCPSATYLARFVTETSKRGLAHSLDVVTDLICPSPLAVRNKFTGKRILVDRDRIPWAQLERTHVVAIRARLTERYAPASVNRHLVALRGCLTECWRAGLVSAEKLAHLIDAARNVSGASARARAEEALRPEEIEALFRACSKDRSVTGARDAALLALLFGAGLRRSSAVAVQLADYARDTGRLVVHGKGGKVAAVYLPAGARKSVEDWLAIRGTEPGALITATSKARKPHRKNPGHSGHVLVRALTDGQVFKICERRALDARLERTFRPHAARRAVAGQAIDVSDLATAQALLMHHSPNVTARYDLRGERRLQVVAERLHVPHFARTTKETPCNAL